MPASKPTHDTLKQAPRRKPGRPFKHQGASKSRTAATKNDEILESPPGAPPAIRRPPTIPFRSFKIALSVFQDDDDVPPKLDKSVWGHKLYGSNRGEILETYRFLGLVDESLAPTADLRTLVAAYGTDAWPEALRDMLERSYQPILASKISTLTAGGLLRTIRTVYRTENENTRRCCNFFIHAAREAALDTGPFLLANSRYRSTNGNRIPGGKSGADQPSYTSASEAAEEAIKVLAGKLPTYEASWSDEVKRLWFGSFLELAQRLRN